MALGWRWWWLQVQRGCCIMVWLPNLPRPSPVPTARGLGHNRPLEPAAGQGLSFQQLVEIYWWPLNGGSQEAWAGWPGSPPGLYSAPRNPRPATALSGWRAPGAGCSCSEDVTCLALGPGRGAPVLREYGCGPLLDVTDRETGLSEWGPLQVPQQVCSPGETRSRAGAGRRAK